MKHLRLDPRRATKVPTQLSGAGAGAAWLHSIRVPWLAALALAIFGLSSIGSGAGAQQESTEAVLHPPRVGMLSLRYPQIESLEEQVREQLQAFQQNLVSVVRNPEATESQLSEAYGLVGQMYHAYSLSDAAELCYFNAHRAAAADFRWIYLLGYLYHKQGRLAESELYYREAHRLYSGYLGVPVHLGDVLFQQNRPTEATAQFEQALELDPSCGAAHFGLGQLALSRGKYADAVGYFQKTLENVPGANRVHYSLAMAYRGLGDLEKAQAHLERRGSVGVRVADRLVDGLEGLLRGERVHLIRGRMAFGAGRFSEAAAKFSKAVSAKPTSIPAHVILGASLAKLGDAEAAMKEFWEVLHLDSENLKARYNLGFLLASAKRFEEAIPHLRAVLEANAEDSVARLLLAQALLETRQIEPAPSQFSRVLESDPANEEALLQQVNLLVSGKRFAEALEQLEKTHKSFPHRGRPAHALATILAACPNPDLRDGARALDLEMRVFKASKSVSHGVTVAMALAELGRCQDAAEWQRRMIAAAEKAQKSDLVKQLMLNLERYEKGQPCRPPG